METKSVEYMLLCACREGNVVEVQRLLPQVGNPADIRDNSRFYWNKTLLHYPCYNGWLDVTKTMVEQYRCDPESGDEWGDTPLHEACREGHVDIVRYLVSEQKCSTTCQNKKGDTPLHEACRKGHLAMVKALTSGQDCKAACTCQNKNGDTPLHEACYWGHVDIVRYLVSEQKCSTTCQNKKGDTPLLIACRKVHLPITRILLTVHDCSAVCNKHGDILIHYSCRHGWLDMTKILIMQYHCDLESKDEWGDTALHVACREGHVDVVRYLISEQECSTASKNEEGDTPLHVACREGHVDIVRYLISEQECSTTCQNKKGDTPLLIACRKKHLPITRILLTVHDCSAVCNKHGDILIHYSCRHGWLDVTKILVEQYRCDPESENLWGDIPLHVACHEGHVDVVRYLISEQECSTASENEKGDTPLHKACHGGHVDVVRYLISEQECSTASENKEGDTPLHVACREGHVDIVRYLISEQECSTTCQNKKGDTPLLIACRKKHLPITRILLTVHDCSTVCNKHGDILIHYSCCHGWLDVTKILVEQYHCDPESEDEWGDTPLHEACREGHVDVVRYLISEQECSTASENEEGDTPLLIACRKKHLPITHIFLTVHDCRTVCNEHGNILIHYSCRHGWLNITKILVEQYHCDLESKDEWGDTALHVACHEGHMDVVRYLISEQECSTERQNKEGDTPLHKACHEGHVDIVKYLVSEQGCSPACQNKWGNTPLHIACSRNRTGIVEFLLSTGRVDPWCKNVDNQTPLQLTYDYKTSKLFAAFIGLAKDPLKTAIKLFVFGNPSAGKSTLVKVIENKFTSRFGTIAGQLRNVSGVELKTAGINTVSIQNSRLGIVTVYDLAGQFEYYSSHDALVENLMSSSVAIFIAVVKFSESEADVIRTLQYWISFIENCCSRVDATAHLMIVGSWADKVKEAGENIHQKWSNIKKACISPSSSLHFVGFTSLDCRKLASSGLDKICDMIRNSCIDLRETQSAEQGEILYPHFFHTFVSTRLSSEVAFSVKELCAHIRAEQDALLPTEPNLLSPLLSSLSDGGHLLYLPNKEDFEAGWLITDKQALLSDINGTVFAPEYFKQHHDIATSTGVVPKSKIAGVFAGKYNVDMILCVLTLFEFCQKIKDSFTLSLVASSGPFKDNAVAMTTSDECLESYYFFPALVRMEHPPEIWQSSGPGQYQCGWFLQCSKEGQYLTPRFLHMLLLRLAFSFALAPDSTQQDEASPVLKRRCAIWKNGIQWLGQDGVETIVEVSEQNKLVLLLMSCPQGEEMACVRLRSSLISKVLDIKKELCPGVSTTELLIDPSNLSTYPLPNSSELTLYRVADQVVKAIRDCEPFAVDITGKRRMKLVKALHFEPYLGLDRKVLDHLFCKYCANDEVSESFLHDLAGNFCPDLEERVPIATLLKVFNVPSSYIQSVYGQFPDERDNHIMRCFRLLVAWKDNFDTGGSTYQSLRTTLDKYSIFNGRDPRDPSW